MNLFDKIKSSQFKLFKSRESVMICLMLIFSLILGGRLFVLQIIKGDYYQDNYNLRIEKTTSIDAVRGNIYDRNGQLLAYNELNYSITIEDSGTYVSTRAKNAALNEIIAKVVIAIDKNGDEFYNDFGITYDDGSFEYLNSGTSLLRFKADVFGHSSISDLAYNDKYSIDEAECSADEMMTYLYTRYSISEDYDEEVRYKIAVVRYNISQNSYQKYITTVISNNVSDASVAFVMENSSELTGVAVEEKYTRTYVDGPAFANVIGYTGKISTDEYNAALEADPDSDISLTDYVGKAGIEQYMNDELSGTKGYSTIFVDNVGNTIYEADYVASTSGNDVYLSIDKDLQVAVYNILEQELAGIIYSKLVNEKTYTTSKSSDIMIPIYDVYYSFIDNNLIKTSHFTKKDATPLEQQVYETFTSCKESALSGISNMLSSEHGTVYNQLSDEYQAYSTYIVTMLKSKGIFLTDKIDSESETQKLWTSEELSVNDYLVYAIENNWIDITAFSSPEKYIDTDETYDYLVDYVLSEFENDSSFDEIVYKYAILADKITGRQLCAILYDQGVLEYDEETRNGLVNGSVDPYYFVCEKIKNLELTPGQLALDPCSASCVVMDSESGEILALVSYPGYDNNILANASDSSYYSYLSLNSANPLYNYATQQRTAPGSTFKPMISAAALAEGVITTTTTIRDEGVFTKVSNQPRCWAYPSSTHGNINVSEALRDSCNYFFYEVGYRFAGSENYNDSKGIKTIQEYASAFGLDRDTGIEIPESTSKIATEYPVMAAIGQSDNNITTIALARYATAITNGGSVYDLTLLDKTCDSDGNELETYSPELTNTIDFLSSSQWDAIHYGMRLVAQNLSSFDNMEIAVAGKTGTAQQVSNRPNHALFIGYAPYDNPEITLAVRIAYGYTSHNASDVAADVFSYYFGLSDDVINGQATSVDTTNTVTD